MSTTYPPFVDASQPETTTNLLASNSDPKMTVQSQPVSSFLKPALLSWINAPYYHVPANLTPALHLSQELAGAAEENFAPAQNDSVSEDGPAVNEPEVLPATAVTVPVAITRRYLPTEPDTIVLEGFDVNKLSPDLQEVVAESHITHVQTVIRFLQKGGESAKTFGKIFLNDLALQRTILGDLMGESTSALGQLDSLQRELALRLAACVQARQVAQLLLVDV